MRHLVLVFSLLCATPAPAANIDAVLQANRVAMGGDAWNAKAALDLEYSYTGQGLIGTTSSRFDLGSGHFADSYDVGPAKGASGFDGVNSWEKDPSGAITLQNGGSAFPLAVNEAYRNANLWWRSDHAGAAIHFDQAKSDALSDALAVTPAGGKEFEAWFDRRTHLLTRIFEQQGSTPQTTRFSDYRPAEGVMLAGKILQSTGNPRYDQIETLSAARFVPSPGNEAFAPPKGHLADFSIAAGAHETVLPFRLLNNHIYADVKIDGKGPFQFIFDTGGVDVVTPSLAHALGLKVEGHMEARGAGSGTMEAGLTKVTKLDLGAASMASQPFAAFPLDALSDIEGVDENGMIGFETFRRFVTRIDYGNRTIALIDPAVFDARDAGTPIPITFDGNVPEIDARYDGIAGKFQLDTGARTALTLTSPFVREHGLRAAAAKGVEAVTGWGVGGATRAYVERAGVLSLGGTSIASPVVLLATDTGGGMAEADIAGNIGAGILKRFVLTLDYAHGVIYVKPVSQPVDDLDSYDRAGMWLNRDPKGFRVIDVTAAAPAAEAGLKPGDVIESIDGKPANIIALPDLRYRFRNQPPGTIVRLRVIRGAKMRDYSLTLRDLI